MILLYLWIKQHTITTIANLLMIVIDTIEIWHFLSLPMAMDKFSPHHESFFATTPRIAAVGQSEVTWEPVGHLFPGQLWPVYPVYPIVPNGFADQIIPLWKMAISFHWED